MASGAPTAVLALLLLLSYVDSHSIGVGPCKAVTPMSGFDITKFFGKWYINGLTSHLGTCQTLFFQQSPTEPNEIKVTQSQEFPIPVSSSARPTANFTGTIVKGDACNPAAMTIKWPVSSPVMLYTVIDTDYTKYALTYQCVSFGASLSYHTTTLLSRDKTLDLPTLQSVIAKAKAASLDTTSFRPISIKQCVPQTDGSAQTSDNHSFNVLGLISDLRLGVIKTPAEIIKEIGFPNPKTSQ